MRCPFCGDTQKNMNEGHLYLKIDLDNDYNIAYNCFKCGEFSSYITEELLELIGCDNSLKNELFLWCTALEIACCHFLTD